MPKGNPLSDEIKREVHRRANAGERHQDLAQEFSIGKSTVHRLRHDASLALPTAMNGKHEPVFPSRLELQVEGIVDGLLSTIADLESLKPQLAVLETLDKTLAKLLEQMREVETLKTKTASLEQRLAQAHAVVYGENSLTGR